MREERLSFDCGVSLDRAGNSQHRNRQVGNRQVRDLRLMLAGPKMWTGLDCGIGFGQIRDRPIVDRRIRDRQFVGLQVMALQVMAL